MDQKLEAICGDALEELKKIPTESIDLIVTDPPYNLNKDYGKTKGFSPRHDDILLFNKNSKKFTFNLDDIRVPQKYYRSVNNMRGANPGNVWEFSHMHYCNRNRKKHPTQKPEALYERMILASSNKGDTVLDPFLGSGTLLCVCQNTERNGIGIDINSEYIEMSKKRLEEKFKGFDSMDERMARIPNDLNDPQIRMEYIENHIKWFLHNHNDAIEDFLFSVKEKYFEKMLESNQLYIFDQYDIKY
jgi:DNA modification methylase